MGIRSSVRLLRTLLILFIVVAWGCGESSQDVINRNKDRFAAKRKEFQEIAALLRGQKADGAGVEPAAIEPKPIYDAKDKKFNTEIVMFEQLEDPDGKPAFDLRLSGNLLLCIQWTGPKNPMSESALRERAGQMTPWFDEAIGYRYLVVHRTAEYRPAQAQDAKNFRGGAVRLEGFVVDMNSKSVLATYTVSARSDSSVEYFHKHGEDPVSQLEAFAHSTLWTNARAEVGNALRVATGGTIILD
jgi:hypothetical protein